MFYLRLTLQAQALLHAKKFAALKALTFENLIDRASYVHWQTDTLTAGQASSAAGAEDLTNIPLNKDMVWVAVSSGYIFPQTEISSILADAHAQPRCPITGELLDLNLMLTLSMPEAVPSLSQKRTSEDRGTRKRINSGLGDIQSPLEHSIFAGIQPRLSETSMERSTGLTMPFGALAMQSKTPHRAQQPPGGSVSTDQGKQVVSLSKDAINLDMEVKVSANKIRLCFRGQTGDLEEYFNQVFLGKRNCLSRDITSDIYSCGLWTRAWYIIPKKLAQLEFWFPTQQIKDDQINEAITEILKPLNLPVTVDDVDIVKISICNLGERDYATAIKLDKLSLEQAKSCVNSFLVWTDKIRALNQASDMLDYCIGTRAFAVPAAKNIGAVIFANAPSAQPSMQALQTPRSVHFVDGTTISRSGFPSYNSSMSEFTSYSFNKHRPS
jgi:hypothetical protein